MPMREVILRLPEELVAEAEEFDLLSGDTVAALLREEIERRVMDMVNQEIHAYRIEKRTRPHPAPPDAS